MATSISNANKCQKADANMPCQCILLLRSNHSMILSCKLGWNCAVSLTCTTCRKRKLIRCGRMININAWKQFKTVLKMFTYHTLGLHNWSCCCIGGQFFWEGPIILIDTHWDAPVLVTVTTRTMILVGSGICYWSGEHQDTQWNSEFRFWCFHRPKSATLLGYPASALQQSKGWQGGVKAPWPMN